MRVDILSLFPGYFAGPFDESILKRARQSGLIDLHLVDIRDFAEGKQKRVDDRPYGGGPGMVLMVEPIVKAVRAVATPKSRVIYLSPQGEPLKAVRCRQLASCDHLILLCGHYEGVDERAIELVVDEEISIGDYVLTNGCLPAIVLLDAVARFIPGVLGNDEAAACDSFEEGRFDSPHYTRPENFEGRRVPEVLLSGHHKEIACWRQGIAFEKMRHVRPDLTRRSCND